MEKKDWHDLQVYRMLAAAWRRAQPHYKKGNQGYTIKSTGDGIHNQIKSIRSTARIGREFPRKKSTEADTITNNIRSMYNERRTTFFVKVGGNHVRAEKKGSNSIGGPSITFTVGYMWYRKVYLRLYYQRRLPHDNWFVLRADEVRVNVPDVRLFKAIAYNFPKNETQEVFIGQCKVGRQQAAIKTTMNAAVEAALQLYQDEIDKQIVGE